MRHFFAIAILLLVGGFAQAIERNVASQSIEFIAVDSATGRPKTGDSANITAYVSIDGDASPDALADTSATELSSTNAPGVYRFALAQGETNGVNIVYSAKSSTSGVDVMPVFVATVPPDFSDTAVATVADIWDYFLNTLGPIVLKFTPDGEAEQSPGTIEFEAVP